MIPARFWRHSEEFSDTRRVEAFAVKHKRQKLVTASCCGALILLSLACGIPAGRRPGPVPFPSGPDEDAGSPLSNADRQFPVQTEAVNSIAFDPTGRWLASGGDDKTVTIWDFNAMRIALQLRGHTNSVMSVAFSPDGKFVASGSKDQTVRVWSASTGQVLQTISEQSEVRSVVFSPDGHLLAGGDAGGNITLWEVPSGSPQRVLRGHFAMVNALAFSPDGKTLASASDDKTIRLWDVQTGGLFQLVAGHAEPVRAVEFSPDGERLASGSANPARLFHGTLKFWEASTGREVSAPPLQSGVSSLAYRPDGRALAIAHREQGLWNIEVIDLGDGRLVRRYIAHRGTVTHLAYSPDGSWLVSASADRFIRCWRWK